MPSYDFHSARLFVDTPLAGGTRVPLNAPQAHYLTTVLRLKQNDKVLIFNGFDGEWSAALALEGRRNVALVVDEQTRPQPMPGDLHYLFAPLKHARLDYMVQKAVEMGVSRLQPVVTRHTHVARVNGARMRANAIEAAEQCGVLAIPEIAEPLALATLIASFEADRLLVLCDEAAEIGDPVAALAGARTPDGSRKLAVLIGPEGGFADEERALLARCPNVVRLALGPRILRADTAAVAALALVQSVLGDWR